MASLAFEPFLFNKPADWFTRMEASHVLAETTSGKTIDLKVYLLATMGSQASSLLADLLAPLTITDKAVDYEKLKDTLLNHLRSQHLEIAERSTFYAAVQEPNETSSAFFSRLKRLSEFCNFDTSLESMLRDRMVLGCRSIEARRQLLQKDPLSLKTVQETLAVFEAIESAKTGALATTVNGVQFSKGSSDKSRSQRVNPRYKQSPRTCNRCGNHNCKFGAACPAMGQKCKKCGKPNHFQVVCRSKAKPSISTTNHSTVLHVDVVPTHKVVSQISLKLNGHTFMMEIDTGAAATLISAKMWRMMGSPALTVSNRHYSAYDGHRMKPIGDLDCQIASESTSIKATITVVEASKNYGLLGRDILEHFTSQPVATNSVSTDSSCYLPPMKIQPVSINVVDYSKLKFCKARPVPLPLVDQVNAELQRLQDQGIIKPVKSSKYASPVVWVKKRNGTLRMCADFKIHVNKSIETDAYPMPATETVFAGMSESKVFAKLDLKEAYWQIPLDVSSREVCTINTSKGLFQMLRLPKGMKNSSSIFQRVLETILNGIAGLIIYQDDILLHAPTSDILAKRLSNVFRRLEEKNVTINKEKSVLNVTEVKFLGHLISASGIRPDPSIASKITSFKPPTTRPELESFLGLVNYFGRMIQNYSKIVQPLHELRKKTIPFHWSDTHQTAFDELLRCMASPPVLTSYELALPTTLTTDASEKAIGGILTQNGKPVMFVSRVLSATEQRYSNVEREALAIVWCVLRLKQLLLGRRFHLVTDHKPLLKIYGSNGLPKVASNRLTRWAILLQHYDFTIEYKPGSSISHADALTRLQLRVTVPLKRTWSSTTAHVTCLTS